MVINIKETKRHRNDAVGSDFTPNLLMFEVAELQTVQMTAALGAVEVTCNKSLEVEATGTC
ncbi:hypothetical protein M413DRAFT_448728 [Hebeloma cylindrosporum]|uniref:Uncharacterized protein n=1 Tax=Hebeloma cylindrosporum TaxID=76867 RepID=A0A0C3BY53_HEBCY|nr:hypothetical protein M413DRAFT_448728 [Hebeloma cylindrosporum h7]